MHRFEPGAWDRQTHVQRSGRTDRRIANAPHRSAADAQHWKLLL